jgi:hypothetical protein
MINWKKHYKNIPSCVKIGKNIYEVLFIDGFPKDNEQLGESRFGDNKQIIINLNQPIKEAVHTYFHEVLHILSFEYKAELKESQVLNLEKGLKDLLKKDNLFKGEAFASNTKVRRNTRKVR